MRVFVHINGLKQLAVSSADNVELFKREERKRGGKGEKKREERSIFKGKKKKTA